MLCQDFPPSRERYTPSPKLTLLRRLASPVPTQMVSGCFSSMAMPPIEMVASWSKIGVQVVPALVDLNRPPDPAAA